MGLSLNDLGIDLGDGNAETTAEPPLSASQSAPAPGITLRDAGTRDGLPSIQVLIRVLGVRKAAAILGDALNQIWGRRPDLMPSHVLLMSMEIDDDTAVEALDTVLRIVLPERTALRTVDLARRHCDAFLTQHPAWQARLADDGVTYEEMERRALLGEFDETGPLNSAFDLETMTYPDAATVNR